MQLSADAFYGQCTNPKRGPMHPEAYGEAARRVCISISIDNLLGSIGMTYAYNIVIFNLQVRVHIVLERSQKTKC
jgi:hypothetical protein